MTYGTNDSQVQYAVLKLQTEGQDKTRLTPLSV